jgi:hypothetical protein
MKKLLIRYKVKPDKVSENESLVNDVYGQLKENKIEGFHYCTFKLADEVTFVHIAFADTEEANNTFVNLPAFKEFQKNLKERCDELPDANQATIIDSYNFFG